MLKKLFKAFSGIHRLGNQMDNAIRQNISSSDIASQRSGQFEVRSLVNWIEIAKLSDVPHIPLKVIATVPTDVIDAIISEKPHPQSKTVFDTLMEGMESVPSSWMVRHDHSGSNDLKIAAAIGELPDDGNEGVGWTTIGNRPIPKFWDERIVKSMAQSLSETQTFVARPWIKAKMRTGLDPHRAGTDLEDTGSWPCEWRVYVMDGKVAGISNYYIQSEATGSESDFASVDKARQYTEEVIETLKRQNLLPFEPMIHQIQRSSKKVQEKMPLGSINFSLDFLETEDGDLVLLEGGPAYTPPPYYYGAHPCAFKGKEWPEGVAFKLDDGVHPIEIPELENRFKK